MTTDNTTAAAAKLAKLRARRAANSRRWRERNPDKVAANWQRWAERTAARAAQEEQGR